MSNATPAPSVAVIVRGTPADAAATVRGVRTTVGKQPHTFYLAVDATAPAEALNRVAAVRTEDLLLFLDGGVVPSTSCWLEAMTRTMRADAVGAAVGGLVGPFRTTTPLAGLLTKRTVFDLLGGFDADRFPAGGYLEDYMARLIGLGYECVAPVGVAFLAGPPQVTTKRAA